MHHAFIDGYSCILVLKKIRNAIAGLPIYPGPSFVRLANNLFELQQQSRQAGQRFWCQRQKKFSSAAWEILLPPPAKVMKGKSVETLCFKMILESILTQARQMSVTIVSIYHTAWAVVQSIYTSAETVVFGTVMSGRDLPLENIEETVGPLINTLPFHVHLARTMSTVDLVHQVFSSLVEVGEF